ncbi:hypothetical protein LXL04_010153 [Taraxacum kok-saghyz]
MAALRATLRPSIATMKRKGERGSPWRTPLDTLNSPVGLPLTKTEAWEDFKQPMIHDLHLVPKPIWFITESRYSQLIESKALSKSTLKSRTFFLYTYFVNNEGAIKDVPAFHISRLHFIDHAPNDPFDSPGKQFGDDFIKTTNQAYRSVISKRQRSTMFRSQGNERGVTTVGDGAGLYELESKTVWPRGTVTATSPNRIFDFLKDGAPKSVEFMVFTVVKCHATYLLLHSAHSRFSAIEISILEETIKALHIRKREKAMLVANPRFLIHVEESVVWLCRLKKKRKKEFVEGRDEYLENRAVSRTGTDNGSGPKAFSRAAREETKTTTTRAQRNSNETQQLGRKKTTSNTTAGRPHSRGKSGRKQQGDSSRARQTPAKPQQESRTAGEKAEESSKETAAGHAGTPKKAAKGSSRKQAGAAMILASLYFGTVCIWTYQTQVIDIVFVRRSRMSLGWNVKNLKPKNKKVPRCITKS